MLNDALSQKDETIHQLTEKVAELEKQVKQPSDTNKRQFEQTQLLIKV
jgi:hypothetical protein